MSGERRGSTMFGSVSAPGDCRDCERPEGPARVEHGRVSGLNRVAGFTLVEMLVMLMLLGVLIAVTLPAFRTAIVRNRLIGPVHDVERMASIARLQAVNAHTQAVIVFHIPGVADEFDSSSFASRHTAVVFVDRGLGGADANTANGRWDSSSNEPIITTYFLPNQVPFKKPGSGDVIENASWTFGSVTTAGRVVFSLTGALANGKTNDSQVFVNLGDVLGNYARLVFNPVTGQARIEKNLPGTSLWLPEAQSSSWKWSY